MTDASIIIEVQGRTDGAKRVKQSLDEVSTSGERATRTMGSFRSTLLAIGAGAVAVSLIKTADAFTNLQNRIRLVTNSSEQLNSVTAQLFQISNQTRSSFQATAEVYTRTALATKELGLSQQETLDFTKSLNQAVILSGANAAEAQAGLIQLSQGLASGALRGDELRSVLEQLPAVADVIAKSLGVTRGELRQMGVDGKITADVIIEAFRNASADLDAKFGTTVPTVGQAVTVLENSFTQLLASFDSSTESTSTLADGLLFIADNLKLLPTAILGLEAILYRFESSVFQIGNSLASFFEATYAGIKAMFEQINNLFKGFTMGVQNFLADPTAGGNFAVLEYQLSKGFVGAFDKAFNEVRAKGRAFNDDLEKVTEDKITFLGREIDKLSNTSSAGLDSRGTRAATTNPLSSSATSAKEASKNIKDTGDNSKELLDTLKSISAETDRFSNNAADAFARFVTGASTAKESLRTIAQELISLASRSLFSSGSGGGLGGALSGILGSALSGGSLFNGIGQSIGSIFSASPVGPYKLPGFADGGSMTIGGNNGVDKNLLSINNQPVARVGKGETLSVSPNGDSSNGLIVNQTINISTGVQQTVRAEIQRMLPLIQKSTTSGVEDAKMRGALA